MNFYQMTTKVRNGYDYQSTQYNYMKCLWTTDIQDLEIVSNREYERHKYKQKSAYERRMYNKIKAINDAGTKIIDYMDDGYTRTRKSMNDRFTKSKIYNYQGTHIDIII